LVKVDSIQHAIYIKCEIISKIFLADLSFGGVVFLDLDKYIFLWYTYFFGVSSVIFMCVIPVVCVTNKEGGEVKQHN
jgi:hypothetical protein